MKDIETLLDFLRIPLASSDPVFDRFAALPGAIRRGSGLEQFVYVPGTRADRVLLIAYADTKWQGRLRPTVMTRPGELSVNGENIRSASGDLGGDARAGCALLWELREMGHSLLITTGYESDFAGCWLLAFHHADIYREINERHQFAIEFGGFWSSNHNPGTDDFWSYVEAEIELKKASHRDVVISCLACRGMAGVNLGNFCHQGSPGQEVVAITNWQSTLESCQSWLAKGNLPKFATPTLDDHGVKDLIHDIVRYRTKPWRYKLQDEGYQALLLDIMRDDRDDDVRRDAIHSMSDFALLAQIIRNSPDLQLRQDLIGEIRNNQLLAAIARHDPDRDIREAAVKRLTDSVVLSELYQQEKDEWVREEIIWNRYFQNQNAKELEALLEKEEFHWARQKTVLKIADDELLAKIAQQDPHVAVRRTAVQCIDDAAMLAKLAREAKRDDVRAEAVRHPWLTDQHVLEEIAQNDPAGCVRAAAVFKLTDTPLLARILQEDEDEDVRVAALENGRLNGNSLIDQALLADLALHDEAWEVRYRAASFVIDQDVLIEIARNDKSDWVRFHTTRKLSDKALAQQVFAEIAREAASSYNRMSAADELDDQALAQQVYADIFKNDPDETDRGLAIGAMTDQKILGEIAQHERSRDLRQTALKNPHLADRELLNEIATKDPERQMRISAIENLNFKDKTVLAEIAECDKNSWVRVCALKKFALVGKNRAEKIEMVHIPGGEFVMGSKSPDAKEDERPLHRVRITAFYMSKYPVTQGQWIDVMGTNPSRFQGDDNRPLENVSWQDCHEFCKKLYEKTGKWYRLPTEAQWEYACRAGMKDDRYGELDDIAWFVGNSKGQTHPVGQKQPNAFGLCDMLGNVWELCTDAYIPYIGMREIDPVSYSRRGMQIIRGGAWNEVASNVRAPQRKWVEPDKGNSDNNDDWFGFRLMMSVEDAEGKTSEENET